MAPNEITFFAELFTFVKTFHRLISNMLFHLNQLTCPKRVFVSCFKRSYRIKPTMIF